MTETLDDDLLSDCYRHSISRGWYLDSEEVARNLAKAREKGRQAGLREGIIIVQDWMDGSDYPYYQNILDTFAEALNSPPPVPTSPPAAPSPPDSK